ncbi:MAG: hypothetical protein LBQ56_03815 [Synergistaceae bacterium]|nr:hypothetical protein [Synergistaceae bacterium]
MGWKGLKKFLCLAAAVAAAVASCAGEARSAEERYRSVFTARDFGMNRDAVKNEIPENGAYRISSRVPNADIWTSFAIPDEEQTYAEWVVTARVRGSEGPASGVGLRSEEGSYALCAYPDGVGQLAYFVDGRKSEWTSDFKIKNFAYPVNMSLWRDANGSVIARVNGVVVAARLAEPDLKGKRPGRVVSVFFATRSKDGSGASAIYETIAVEGWGPKGAPETQGASLDLSILR